MKKIMFALVSIILISACVGSQTSATTTSSAATTQAGPALPALRISDSLSFSKVAGQISMSATIFNKGNAAAENVIVGAEVKEKATGKLIYPEEQRNKGTIGAGGSQILLKYYGLSDGNYTLTIRADPAERISESDESNNILIKDFSVPIQ